MIKSSAPRIASTAARTIAFGALCILPGRSPVLRGGFDMEMDLRPQALAAQQVADPEAVADAELMLTADEPTVVVKIAKYAAYGGAVGLGVTINKGDEGPPTHPTHLRGTTPPYLGARRRCNPL